MRYLTPGIGLPSLSTRMISIQAFFSFAFSGCLRAPIVFSTFCVNSNAVLTSTRCLGPSETLFLKGHSATAPGCCAGNWLWVCLILSEVPDIAINYSFRSGFIVFWVNPGSESGISGWTWMVWLRRELVFERVFPDNVFPGSVLPDKVFPEIVLPGVVC